MPPIYAGFTFPDRPPSGIWLSAWVQGAQPYQAEILYADAASRLALVMPLLAPHLARVVAFALLHVALYQGREILQAYGKPPPAPAVPEWARNHRQQVQA